MLSDKSPQELTAIALTAIRQEKVFTTRINGTLFNIDFDMKQWGDIQYSEDNMVCGTSCCFAGYVLLAAGAIFTDGSVVEPLVAPAITAIDLDDIGQRIGDRKWPLAAATMARIRWGQS